MKETALDGEVLDKAISTFYTMMGWDGDTGVPKVEKLEELGIGWVAEHIGVAD